MNFNIIFNKKTITVNLEKKLSMKHTYLKIKDSNNIEIKSNIFFTKKNAISLIHKKQIWIENSFAKLIKKESTKNDFFYLGLKANFLNSINADRFYKKEAKILIPKIINEFCHKMQVVPNNIKYRRNKGTWGSCSYKNDLNFNIYLMKYPLKVIEYVVIHELAHIKHKNHSKLFWNFVSDYCSDYKKQDEILKNFL